MEATDPLDPPPRQPARHLPRHRWPRLRPHHQRLKQATTRPNTLHPLSRTNSLLNRRRWRTRMELSTAPFEYLEIFHNRQRRHSALGMLSPVEYELRAPPVA
ncbi:IS3 family transposase [Streptomyces sp. 15-116A]|uniref:IS3 family transposase n=1 Tax=Streptomyces sp. 15-116A TaxID=2259035 RepID=UPI0037D9FA0B